MKKFNDNKYTLVPVDIGDVTLNSVCKPCVFLINQRCKRSEYISESFCTNDDKSITWVYKINLLEILKQL